MSWSEVVWLVVAIVAGYWIITSGFIQNFAMGLGKGGSNNQFNAGPTRMNMNFRGGRRLG